MNYEENFQKRLTAELTKQRAGIASKDDDWAPFLLTWGPSRKFVRNKIDSGWFEDGMGDKLGRLITEKFPAVLRRDDAEIAAFFYPLWVKDESEDGVEHMKRLLIIFTCGRDWPDVKIHMAPTVRFEDGTVGIGDFEPYTIHGGDMLVFIRAGFAPLLRK